MNIVWSPEAERDREEVWDYIAADNLNAAVKMDKLFSEAVAQLLEFPKIGRRGKITGTRELVPHTKYRLVYEIKDDTILILALVHTARLWPPVKLK